MIYALAAFHFLSGIIRNDVRLLTLSVVVVFLYGGLIWGIFPIDPKVSWEGHLWGAVCGLVLAFYYRKYIIRRDKFEWEEEEEEEENSDIPPGHDNQIKPVTDITNPPDKTAETKEKKRSTGYHTGFPERFNPENMNHT